MIVRILLLVIYLSVCTAARAEKVMTANCNEGEGCRFSLSEVSVADADIVLDEDNSGIRQPGDILVFGITKNGKQVQYWERRKSRGEIDKDWGGDGYTMIHLFDPQIQPLNGTWKAVYGTVTGSDCYVNIRSILGRLQGTAGSGNILFKAPFTPYQLFPSADMKWSKTGYARYRGILDFGQGSISAMKMVYNIHIINRERIETAYDVVIKIPVKGTCTARIPVTFTCVGPDKD